MQKLIQQGIDAFELGSTSTAVELLTQAVKQYPKDESAWLYLGLATNDIPQKHDSFSKVLAINPANQRALDALAAIDIPPQSISRSGLSIADPLTGFSNPIRLTGTLPAMTIVAWFNLAHLRVGQAFQLNRKRDPEAYFQLSIDATMGDGLSIVVVIGVVAAVGQLLGRLLALLLNSYHPGPVMGAALFIYALGAFVSTVGGFGVGVWAATNYMKARKASISPAQYGLWRELIVLPLSLIYAAYSLVFYVPGSRSIIALVLVLVSFVLAVMRIRNWSLLKRTIQRATGLPNGQAWVAVGTDLVAGLVVSVIIQTVVNSLTR